MRLIDADVLKADYGMKDDCADCEKELQGKVRSCEYNHIYSTMDFCGWIDDAQTIDAVEVVRCKDCKHYYFAENRVPEEQSWVCDVWHVNQTAHMGYCFKAERRSDETNRCRCTGRTVSRSDWTYFSKDRF